MVPGVAGSPALVEDEKVYKKPVVERTVPCPALPGASGAERSPRSFSGLEVSSREPIPLTEPFIRASGSHA